MLAAFPIGVAIQVNPNTDHASDFSTAATATGGFISVWRDGQLDGDDGGIYARRFGASGAPIGAAFRVNNLTVNDQTAPDVAVLPNGRISFGWSTTEQISTFNYDFHTDVRRFSWNGTPMSDSVRVSEGAAGADNHKWTDNAVKVFADASNNTWIVNETTDNARFFVRRMNSAGTQTAAFAVDLLEGYRTTPANSTPWSISNFYYTSLEVTPQGELIAGYEIQRERLIIDVGQRYDHKTIVRRFSSSGVRQNDFLLNNMTLTQSVRQGRPGLVRAAVAPDGTLGVVWKSSSNNLVYRNFTLAGVAVSPTRILVAGSTFSDSSVVADNLDIHFLPNGNLIVAWNEAIPFENDENWVREFNGLGIPIGPAASFAEDTDKAIDLEIDGATNDHVFISWERFAPGFPTENNNVFVRKIGFGNAPANVKGDPNWSTRYFSFGIDSPIDVGRTVTVSDNDSPNLDGNTLRIRINAGKHGSNRLQFIGTGVAISSGSVSVDGVVIGTMATGAGVGFSSLDVALNTNATTARVQKLIRTLRFHTTSAASTAQRRIDISLADSTGLSGAVHSVLVVIFV